MARLSIVELTPPGRGAIATLLVHGPGATRLVARLVRRESRSSQAAADDRLSLAWIGPEPAEQIVLRTRGAEAVELHCHGGLAVARLAQLLEEQGAHRIAWRDWAAGQGEDSIAVDALAALAGAPTESAAAILLDQYAGSLRRALESIQAALATGRCAEALQQIDALRRWTPLGTHLVRPWRVVLAGRPNVGKSSLLNALLGFSRALVNPVPGTTRDVLTARTAMHGWPVELVDTAGLREAEHPLEQAGVSLAQQELEGADLVVLVLDRSTSWNSDDEQLLRNHPSALLVHNKADLPEILDPRRPPGLVVSAAQGQGLDALMQAIVDRLVSDRPAPGAAVPFTVAQDEALAAAGRALDLGDPASAEQVLSEATSFALRDSAFACDTGFKRAMDDPG